MSEIVNNELDNSTASSSQGSSYSGDPSPTINRVITNYHDNFIPNIVDQYCLTTNRDRTDNTYANYRVTFLFSKYNNASMAYYFQDYLISLQIDNKLLMIKNDVNLVKFILVEVFFYSLVKTYVYGYKIRCNQAGVVPGSVFEGHGILAMLIGGSLNVDVYSRTCPTVMTTIDYAEAHHLHNLGEIAIVSPIASYFVWCVLHGIEILHQPFERIMFQLNSKRATKGIAVKISANITFEKCREYSSKGLPLLNCIYNRIGLPGGEVNFKETLNTPLSSNPLEDSMISSKAMGATLIAHENNFVNRAEYLKDSTNVFKGVPPYMTKVNCKPDASIEDQLGWITGVKPDTSILYNKSLRDSFNIDPFIRKPKKDKSGKTEDLISKDLNSYYSELPYWSQFEKFITTFVNSDDTKASEIKGSSVLKLLADNAPVFNDFAISDDEATINSVELSEAIINSLRS